VRAIVVNAALRVRTATYSAYDPMNATPPPPVKTSESEQVENIHTVVTADSAHLLSDELSQGLLRFLSVFILHELPDPPKGEGPFAITTPYFLRCHRVALPSIRSFSPQKAAPIRGDDFLCGLVKALASPDQKEQAEVRQLIKAIVEASPETEERVIHFMKDRVRAISFGLAGHFALVPILEFLVAFYQDPTHVPVHGDAQWVQRYAIPLLALEHLPIFYSKLREFFAIFYNQYDHLSVAAIRYLLSHWPVACPDKLGYFVSHIAEVLGFMPDDRVRSVSKAMFRRFCDVLDSGPEAVAVEVMKLLAGASFITRFEDDPQAFPQLYGAARNHADSWSKEAARLAGVVTKKLRDVYPSCAACVAGAAPAPAFDGRRNAVYRELAEGCDGVDVELFARQIDAH
jgi:hypothetical protein